MNANVLYMGKILFQERQKFTQWWLWLLLLAPIVFSLFRMLLLILSESSASNGNLSISLAGPYDFWIFLLVSIMILVFMFIIRMETVIDSEKINVKHLLFVKRTFEWEDIESTELVKYGFVGYGIRLSMKYGTVYNVKGNMGLAITLKSGKKYLIGTQKPDELIAAVKSSLK